MRPELFYLGPLPIYSYGFMILLGFLMGIRLGAARFRAKGISPELIYDIGLVAMVSGVLGARLFYLVQYRHHFDWTLFSFRDGISLAGALLGALVFLAVYRKPQNWPYLIITALALILGKYQGMFKATPGQFHIVDLAFLLLTIYLVATGFQETKSLLRQAERSQKIWFAAGLLISSVIGLRGLHCYRFADNYSWDVFAIWRGGLVFYGGFVCATACLMFFFKKHKLPVLKVCDILAPTVALGLAFTRLGCFLNGCCFGGMCPPETPYGVHFPAHSLAGQSQNLRGLNLDHIWKSHAPKHLHYLAQVPGGQYEMLRNLKAYLPQELYHSIFQPVYPSQLLASLNGFIIFWMLIWFYRYRKHDGELILLFGIIYSLARFWEETLRNDTSFVFGTSMTVSQVVSYVLFSLCGGILIFLRGRDLLRRRASSVKIAVTIG